MNNKPYITYLSKPLEIQKIDSVLSKCYVNEVGQVSFGTIDYIPGWFIALHHHYTWELIIIDCSSVGPGYTLFNGCWWRAEPGSAVFIPKGFSHAWSSGNDKGFKMLWVYGGSHEEADRLYDVDPQIFQPISQEEERAVFAWKAKVTR